MAVRSAQLDEPESHALEPEKPLADQGWGVRMLRHPLYPGLLQVVLLLVFSFAIWQAFLGPPHGENNPATTLIWTVWWPLLPFSFFLFARAWCAVCPLGAASAFLQRLLRGLRWRPDSALTKAGPWVMAVSVFVIAIANLIWGLEEFPVRTGVFFLILLMAATITGLLYRGHAWCRYLCPIGALSGLFSMSAIIELRANRTTCQACEAKSCRATFDGDSRCQFFEIPLALSSNRNCNLCGDCVKACANDGFSVRRRTPLAELSRPRPGSAAEFTVIALFISMTWFEAFRMTPPYPAFMKMVVRSGLAPSYDMTLVLVFVAVTAAMAAICYLPSRTRPSTWPVHALVPLALAGHIAVGAYHILLNGPRALAVTVNALDLPFLAFKLDPVVRGSMYSMNLPVKAVQATILLAGVAASGYLAFRLRGSQPASTLRLVRAGTAPLLVAIVFLIAFALPTALMH